MRTVPALLPLFAFFAASLLPGCAGTGAARGSAEADRGAIRILFLGGDEAYPSRVVDRLNARFEFRRMAKRASAIDSRERGSTPAISPDRLREFLPEKPRVLVLTVAADGDSRGTAADLEETIALARDSGVKTVLVGAAGASVARKFGLRYVRIPPGERDSRKVADRVFPVLEEVLTEGVAGNWSRSGVSW